MNIGSKELVPSDETGPTRDRSYPQLDTHFSATSTELWLSLLSGLQALAFVVIAFACEAAGTHWSVGAVCVLSSFICVGICLYLHGLRLRHFLAHWSK